MPQGNCIPIVSSEVDRYLSSILPGRDPILHEMESHAERVGFPIVGPQVGRLLQLLAALVGAKRVFEMGSGFGYSAWWFSKGMGPEGRVVCTDGREENARWALDAFRRAGMESAITFHVGDAREILKEHAEPYDLIFIDIDKWQYPEAFDLAVPRVRAGGLLVADNLLWDGRVVLGSADRDTSGVLEYTRKAMAHPSLWTVVLPVRDGVGISRKHGGG